MNEIVISTPTAMKKTVKNPLTVRQQRAGMASLMSGDLPIYTTRNEVHAALELPNRVYSEVGAMAIWVCRECGEDHAACRCEMKLPAGEFCGKCAHWKRCSAFGFSTNYYAEECDFSPSRFKPASKTATGAK